MPQGQEHLGPDVRPLCEANEAPNSRFSHFLSKILCDYADCIEDHHECKSSEEMRAALEDFNKFDRTVRENCVLLSMDVKALYPSMQWDDIVIAVQDMIVKNRMEIANVDWTEVGKYVAVMVPQDVIEQQGLVNVVPKRKRNRTRHITINYLRNKKNNDNWTVARKPGCRQKTKLLALAISTGVKLVMANHTYRVGDQYYLQASGGAIGLELTGAVSRAFMARWDRIYLGKVKKAGIKMLMYDRYVDDSNQLAEIAPPGSEYNVLTGKLTGTSNQSETDEARTARILKEIANSVQNGIVMELDHPNKNDDKKLPILDMKVWLDEDKFAVYEHYEKPVANRQVVQAKSALSSRCKQSVHVNEVVRRLLNTSADYMARMELLEIKQ